MDDLGSYGSAPARVLNSRTRRYLARWLDPSTTAMNSQQYPQFWEGLAELMGYDYQTLKNFARASSPTLTLLDDWTHNCIHTVEKLWNYLLQLEVHHILEDSELHEMIIQDVTAYQSREKEDLTSKAASTASSHSADTSSHHDDEATTLTTGDEPDRPELFDAFVCYAYPDFHFVQQLIDQLEGVHQLKLCIQARDLLPGTSEHTVTAQLIEERCKRVIIILSPAFMSSPECDFQMKFAQALSPGARDRKLIPIIITPNTPIPKILLPITKADCTRVDQRTWLWPRLVSAIQEKQVAVNRLENLEIELPPVHPELPRLKTKPGVHGLLSDTNVAEEINLPHASADVKRPSLPGSASDVSADGHSQTKPEPDVSSDVDSQTKPKPAKVASSEHDDRTKHRLPAAVATEKQSRTKREACAVLVDSLQTTSNVADKNLQPDISDYKRLQLGSSLSHEYAKLTIDATEVDYTTSLKPPLEFSDKAVDSGDKDNVAGTLSDKQTAVEPVSHSMPDDDGSFHVMFPFEKDHHDVKATVPSSTAESPPSMTPLKTTSPPQMQTQMKNAKSKKKKFPFLKFLKKRHK